MATKRDYYETLGVPKNATEEERDHTAKNWQMMLDGLKKLLEQ